ncbi:DUF6773 family protein [Peptostreptococcus faecalis]|uniref:DUF6773 family protein n=1 Tax=Peptostreptococcus faecalis TaxID=2045015 RepID=UPI000C7CC945|nr:DUF6773 family protein [Peptostreptococcus faecalis]
MKLKQKNKIKDERVLQLDNKIKSEACSIIMSLSMASFLIKSIIFDMPFSQYSTELAIVIVAAIYIVARSTFIGHSIMDNTKTGKKYMLFTAISTALIVAAINGFRNYHLYGDKYTGIFDELFIAILVITFISAFIFTSITLLTLYWFNKKGQERIEKKLDDENNLD